MSTLLELRNKWEKNLAPVQEFSFNWGDLYVVAVKPDLKTFVCLRYWESGQKYNVSRDHETDSFHTVLDWLNERVKETVNQLEAEFVDKAGEDY